MNKLDLMSAAPDAELSATERAERAERQARLAATRQQILNAQATGANRDAQALARERAWMRQAPK